MSDSNQGQLSYVKEVIRGVTPSANLKILPFSSESLNGSLSSTVSQTIRSDRNIADNIRTDLVPQGGVNAEIGHEFYDDLIEGAFNSAFETPISLTGITFSIDASGSPITLDDSGSGLGGLKPNDVIMISGFTDSNNNGAFSVGGNTAAGSVDIVPVSPSSVPVTEAAGDSVTITTTRLENGVTPSFFSFERLYNDVTKRMAWLGMEVDTMTLEFGASSVPTIAFNFIGDSHPKITSSIGTGYTAASTNEIINTIQHYKGTLLGVNGGVLEPASGVVTKTSFTFSNSVRRTNGLGQTVVIGRGAFSCQVGWDIVFTDLKYYDAFQDDQNISLCSVLADSSNQGFGITVPNISFTSAGAPITGPNAEVIGSYQGQAILATVGSDTYTAVFSKLG